MEPPADLAWNGYTLAERDWRWQRVRDNAAKAGFDCTFVPLCVDSRNLHLSLEQARGTRSDGRFLTQLENAAVIFPTDGRKPTVISDQESGNEWVPEFRPVEGSWGKSMAQALIDCGMERARIGVSGLRRGFYTHGRAFHGVINHSSYAEVLQRLPNARFENATEAIGYARYVKSEEQIACLRRGAAIAAAGIEKMIELARPGMDEGILYARVMHRMISLGSEYYPLAFYSGAPAGGRLPRFEDPTRGRFLQPGYRIANEVDAVFGSLIAQEQQPIFLGPIPEAWKAAIKTQRDLYYAGLEQLIPGKPFAEFMDFVNTFGEKRGMKSLMLMHGRGYGDDGPLFTPQNRGARNRDVLIEKGNVFIVKPIVSSADGSFDTSWGGCVLVTEKGGEPLVKRTPGMVSIT
ncbi:MAG TPA: M24 family metallopeptidase [Candidatus Udaeobacter sp.]|jgi:Xaa-Pro aminopeptidase|nr:M24 family metallopeptidase [Candidatus Udaeobacter sp.]